ncbi:MAG: hypothetical protein LC795_21000 [Acidobacteria bacterium]|nr:hypothetical protein [Acidobacteriota bacterium]
MYDTGGSYSVCQLGFADDNVARRLSWLRFELAPETERRRLALEVEERRTLSMLRPLSTEEAYRWFGTFLGLFPPFALFTRILGDAIGDWAGGGFPMKDGALLWALLFILMNAVCCLVGRKFGGFLGRKAGDPRAHGVPGTLLVSLLYGLFWGVVTGAAGGAVGFLVGAVVGVFVAVPVALAAFPVFALLHRLLSHGGMIEERQVWPLAFGVPLTITALILSPWFN